MSQNQQTFPFEVLSTSDLIPGAIYESDHSNRKMTSGADPLPRLLGAVGNQGGFRPRAGKHGNLIAVALTSSGEHSDWPDTWDPKTGQYIYYGDNRTPGSELHDTTRGGNKLLRTLFEIAHGPTELRLKIPLVLVFRRGPRGRDQEFLGLAVPGAVNLGEDEDLIAIWRSRDGHRFQNYRAVFTILDTGPISGEWVRQSIDSRAVDYSAMRVPDVLMDWINEGKYAPRITC